MNIIVTGRPPSDPRIGLIVFNEPLDRVTQCYLERRKLELDPKKRLQLLVGGRFTELPIRTGGVKLVMLAQ